MSTPRTESQSAVAVKCCPRCHSETCTDPDSKGCSDNCIGNYQKIIKQWETWGIVEIAVRNPQVAEWMAHWETRCLKAEKELSTARAEAFAECARICRDGDVIEASNNPMHAQLGDAYATREAIAQAIEAAGGGK